MIGDVPTPRLTAAHDLLQQAVHALTEAAGPGGEDADLLAALTVAEGASRRLDRITVAAIATLHRRGAFAERGYRNPVTALADLLGCDRTHARRRVLAAEQVHPRTGLDGQPLPPRLPATAALFTSGAIGIRHVETITRVLGLPAAQRLDPDTRAAAEEHLAAHATACTPGELLGWGTTLVETLDQDGPEPDDDRPRPQVNELRLRRHRDRPGGTLTGHYDDGAMFDAIATVLDAATRPTHRSDPTAPGPGNATPTAPPPPPPPATGDDIPADERTPAQRAAAALADACGYVLDHGDLPRTAGERPHLTVLIRLEDLEHRARGAVLDLGGTLSPAALRTLACDAEVVPVVLGGDGHPLDVGQSRRTVPGGLRRAVVVRDRGCARCGRPPSWCEVHHIHEWQHGGPTALPNLVLLCRACHRLIHHAGWTVQMVGGRAEFTPPAWIDPDRRPRRGPPRVIDLDDLLTAPRGTPVPAPT